MQAQCLFESCSISNPAALYRACFYWVLCLCKGKAMEKYIIKGAVGKGRGRGAGGGLLCKPDGSFRLHRELHGPARPGL
jgi:hypothetical protein